MGRYKIPFAARFWQKVDVASKCWLWTGKPLPNGYGYLTRAAPETGWLYAHRISWEMAAGPIPKGLTVCHTCDVRLCVRNDEEGIYVVKGVEYPRWGHLWLGTHAANIADRDEKGRWSGGRPLQSHCKRGHELTPESTYANKNGTRACKACARLRQDARRAKQRKTQSAKVDL